MTEVIVATEETPPDEGQDVLGAAAVASAAIAGHAAADAAHAADSADDAAARAAAADDTAAAAFRRAMEAPSRDEVRAIAQEEAKASEERIAAALETIATKEPPAPIVEEKPHEDPLPKSVAKKKTFAERFFGVE